MMKMKRFVAVVLSGILAAGLAACSSPAPTPTPAAGSPAPGKDSYTIGICQLVQHPALDVATQGFQDALVEKLGDKVKFDLQNASGDGPSCGPIINTFVSNEVDLILANATIPLQTAAAATADIPILGTSVTDYATALDVDDWTGTTGRNISGTTDLAPLDGQAAIIKELFPNAKRVGIIYCSGEPNSKYQARIITELLTEMGYTCTEYTFADSNDLTSVATNACSAEDVLYAPTDNVVASNREILKNVAVPAGIPIVSGEENACAGCGVATLSIDYYDLGYQTGEMAYDILVNGADISTMEVAAAPLFTKKYNPEICATLGITPPADYLPIG